MQKGSPRIILRVPPLLLAAVDAEIERTNKNVKLAPFCRSTWVLAAIIAKLNHAERSRKKRAKQKSVRQPAALAG